MRVGESLVPVARAWWCLTGRGNRGFSQTFYREKVHEKHFGYKDLEAFMQGFWETWACSKGIHSQPLPIMTYPSIPY